MKHLISIFLICVIIFAVLPMAFASSIKVESLPEGYRYVDTEENLALGPVELVQVTEPIIETTEPVELIPLNVEDLKRKLISEKTVSVQSNVTPVTPNNTNGLKKIMIQLIGNYDPVVVEYSYQSSQGYTSYLREIEPDFAWLCSCAIFLVVLYSIFRIFGMVIQWRQ